MCKLSTVPPATVKLLMSPLSEVNIFSEFIGRAAPVSARSLPVEVFCICFQQGGDPGGEPRTHIWSGNTSGSPRIVEDVAREKDVGVTLLPPSPRPG